MKKARKTPLEIPATAPQLCTVDLRLRLLGGLPFFAQLRPDELSAVNQKFREDGYQAGEFIYHAGDPAAHLYVVAEGRVKLFQTAASGRSVLLDLLTAGDFFGSLSGLPPTAYPDTAQAHTAGCILRISADDFRQIIDLHPPVALAVLDTMAHRLHAANQRVFLLSSMPVEQRIAATLLRLADKLGQPDKTGLLIHTPLSREDLAEMTGSTPESASRVVSQFQKAGWIATGRQWISLRDLAALRGLIEVS
jgi:CRP/FNR family transcriptional regulator, nitrogen oxide reductase regulator